MMDPSVNGLHDSTSAAPDASPPPGRDGSPLADDSTASAGSPPGCASVSASASASASTSSPDASPASAPTPPSAPATAIPSESPAAAPLAPTTTPAAPATATSSTTTATASASTAAVAPAPTSAPSALGPHAVNGSLATPSPRAPTSAGDVHEEFFGDDPLPDADWEQRSVRVEAVPAEMGAAELRRVMCVFGPVEDVQLVGEETDDVTGHVVFRLSADAVAARASLREEGSLAALRELECPEEAEAEAEAEEAEAREEEASGRQQHHQHHQPAGAATAPRGLPLSRHAGYHPTPAPQFGYGRVTAPQAAPFFCHPAASAVGAPWTPNQGAAAAAAAAMAASMYYPIHPQQLYGGLAAHHGTNYLLPGPPQQAAAAAAAMAHRKHHRGLEDGDGPCVRLVVHTRLVGAIIGVGGATIRRITRHQVRVDVDNNIMKRPWPPSTGRHAEADPGVDEGAPRSLQSQVVFIYGAQEAVERAVADIMQLVQREARSKKLEHEPDLALLVDNALCGRIIGKGGHKIKRIRESTEVDIVLCNETIIRYEDMYHVYLTQTQYDLPSLRIISIRGELDKCLDAFRQLVTCINEIRRRSPLDASGVPLLAAAAAGGHMPSLPGFVPGRPMPAVAPGLAGLRQAPYLPLQRLPLPAPRRPNGPGPGIASPEAGGGGGERAAAAGGEEDEAEEEAALPLHLDLESLYVLVPNSTGGAIIGTEGRNIHKIMELTAASVTVSKHLPQQQQDGDRDEEEAPVEEGSAGPPSESRRLVTIRAGSDQSLDLALHFIFRKVQACRRDGLVASRGHKAGPGRAAVLTVVRAPRALLGRVCGRHHQHMATLQRQANAQVDVAKPWFADLLPSNRPEDNEGVEFDNIFIQGDLTATQLALVQLRARLLDAFYAYSQQHGLQVPYSQAMMATLPTFGSLPHPGLGAGPPHAAAAAAAAAGMYPAPLGPHGPFAGSVVGQAPGLSGGPGAVGLLGPGPGPVMYRHLGPGSGLSFLPPSGRPRAQHRPGPTHASAPADHAPAPPAGPSEQAAGAGDQ